MTRAYIRLDPAFDERKESYPDGPYAALIATFCLAEHQPERGRFRSFDYLTRLLGRRGRHAKYLLEHGDVVELEDGRVYVDGWDEWQEGDWKVAERVGRIRSRDKQGGRERTANWRLRSKVFERDGFTCRYCGVSDYPREWLVLEHVIPVTKGGSTDEGNLVTACRGCNKRKGDHTPEEVGMTLRDASQSKRDVTSDASPVTADRKAVAVAKQSIGVAVTDDDDRPDVRAFILIKGRAPSRAQQRLLDDILDRRDESGPAWAADIMLAHQDDPIGAVLAADRSWREERLREARAAERPAPKPKRRPGLPESTKELLAHWAATKDGGEAA